MNELLIPQSSIFAACVRLCELAGGEIIENDGFITCDAGVGFMYSRHTITAASDENAAEIAERLSDGPVLLSFTEDISGKGFFPELEKRGWVYNRHQAGMYRTLAEFSEPDNDPHVVRIGKSDLEEWSNVVETAFGKTTELDALRYFIRDDGFFFYAWREGGKILGTTLTYSKDGNCGIHEVGTLPSARGRGVCTALISRAMYDAKKRGDSIASLQASKLGRPVYERLGMRVVSAMPIFIRAEA